MLFDVKVCKVVAMTTVVRQVAPNADEAERLAKIAATKAFASKGKIKRYSEEEMNTKVTVFPL